jgi:membrane-bound lytic murein transglycosylase D
VKKIIIIIFVILGLSVITNAQSSNYYEYLSSLKLPDTLYFCGERVPLEITEVRERAEREFYLLLQQPGQIILYLKRSGRYFPLFEKILKEKDMPDDLKYVSVAESALFMSRSVKGAVGLWQFMPSTAKAYGLQVDDYVDERCHPEKSTFAALSYLKDGYDAHKSWLLAVAGYNMGYTNINSAKEFQGSNDYFDLFLNEETSRYILRIVIIKEVMTNAAKYGFKIDKNDYYKPDETSYIECKEGISNLADWAKDNGTSYKDVKLLNPWIIERKLPQPQKGESYLIAVPSKK